jgi:hypothetical protein
MTEDEAREEIRVAARGKRHRLADGTPIADLLGEACDDDEDVEEACDILRGEADELFAREIRR